MNIKSKILILLNLLYCYIPVCLFLLGWVKWWIAMPTTIILCYFFYQQTTSVTKDESVYMNRIMFVGGQ